MAQSTPSILSSRPAFSSPLNRQEEANPPQARLCCRAVSGSLPPSHDQERLGDNWGACPPLLRRLLQDPRKRTLRR
jgi:hypothetical protein